MLESQLRKSRLINSREENNRHSKNITLCRAYNGSFLFVKAGEIMALVHILDRQTDDIIGTLNSSKKEFKDAIRHDSLNGENTFNFTSLLKTEKAGLLEKRNRLLILDVDGKLT